MYEGQLTSAGNNPTRDDQVSFLTQQQNTVFICCFPAVTGGYDRLWTKVAGSFILNVLKRINGIWCCI